MNLYDIYVPQIATYVKFKVLDPEDTETFLHQNPNYETTEFKKLVLENYIFNLRTEILDTVKQLPSEESEKVLDALYNACVQLNPALDVNTWLDLSFSELTTDAPTVNKPVETIPQGIEFDEPEEEIRPDTDAYDYRSIKPFKMTKAKYLNLGKMLRSAVIGQEEAINRLEGVLKRSQAGLNDTHRPLGVLIFAGSSGTGKTLLAKTLQSYLFGEGTDIVRVDCGELQNKHENQKLIGAPPGYIGHEAGGSLTNAVMKNPYSVVLIDEIEKTHTDVFNTFLRMFDEGLLTDGKGRTVSFRNCIIIMTTNLGNRKIVEDITSGGVGFNSRLGDQLLVKDIPKRDVVERETLTAIKKHFSPELLNRVDDVIVFNHLSQDDLRQIADLEIAKTDAKLVKRGIRLSYDETVLDGIVELGTDTIKGARGMEYVRRDRIENIIADQIIDNRIPRGSVFELSYKDNEFMLNVRKPVKKSENSQ